ncbi:Novel protein (Zgc:110560), related [Neospora caninum Liverpool]|uniref:Novel protein (Zgc:110560), related n=1 Tax=Neospora caninum (strain Liverpool) TaxID=572307 RepID=F0VFQ2_NEOCL|nr:Novel protein (Zgc:110560), related [Neospora caninum Liverpool]CBZ52546.1 Novel protein (Zgc:110560), related [Neospora caninum Liverpool]CEL66522.1 TPA: Novel protein (Zgc:110560), related [Neospora caninum Liverpool]|eukprot:XP_003882578.1 Novel protein (Zgc:110560), related [Neospora caninum Liverpool]
MAGRGLGCPASSLCASRTAGRGAVSRSRLSSPVSSTQSTSVSFRRTTQPFCRQCDSASSSFVPGSSSASLPASRALSPCSAERPSPRLSSASSSPPLSSSAASLCACTKPTLSSSVLRPFSPTGGVPSSCISQARRTFASFRACLTPSCDASSSFLPQLSCAARPTPVFSPPCVRPSSRGAHRPGYFCVPSRLHPADAALHTQKRNCGVRLSSFSSPRRSPTFALSTSSSLACRLPAPFLPPLPPSLSASTGRRSRPRFLSASFFSRASSVFTFSPFSSALSLRIFHSSSFPSPRSFPAQNPFEDSGSSSEEEDAWSSSPFGGFAPEARSRRGEDAHFCRGPNPRSVFDKVGEEEGGSRQERPGAENTGRGRRNRALRDAAARRMLEREALVVDARGRWEQGESIGERGEAEDGYVTPLLSAFAAVRQGRKERGADPRRDDAFSPSRAGCSSFSLGKSEALTQSQRLGYARSTGHPQGSASGLRSASDSPLAALEPETDEHAADHAQLLPVSSAPRASPGGVSPSSRSASAFSSASVLESRFGVAVSPSVFEALTNDMRRLESLMLPGTEDQAGMRRFLSQLQDLLNGVLDACVVTPFGSAVNGLWTPQSDLDVCVQVREASTRASQIKVLRQVAHALHPVHTHLVEPRFQARVPIIHWSPRFSHSASGPALLGRFLRDPVARALHEKPGDARSRGREDEETGRRNDSYGEGDGERNTQMVSCDISVNNLLAVVNSKLLGAYVGIDPRLRTLGYAVKFWAKGRNINDRSRGTVSSFSLVLMLIHFLQNHVQPRILPSLQDMAIHQRLPPVYIGGVDCRYTTDPEAVKKELEFLRGGAPPNTESPGELLLQFFRYFGYEYRGGVIAIRNISHFCLPPRASSLDTKGVFADYGGGSLFRDKRPKLGASRRVLPPQKTSAWGLDGALGEDENMASSFASNVAGSDTREGRAGDDDLLASLSASLREADLHSSGGDFLVVDNPFEVGKDVCNVLPCQYQRIRHEFKRAFRMLADGASFRQVASPDGKTAFR